jgi:hypothetical protein
VLAVGLSGGNAMSISSVKISCETVSRDRGEDLEITILADTIAIHYGSKDRDLFIVKRSDFVEALQVLGVRV